MKRFGMFLFAITVASIQVWAQKTTPEEKSIVNKEYDENGNLIQYDSTYVWNWNSDSTMNFSFNDKFDFGKDFQDMFGEFAADSIFEKFGMLNGNQFKPLIDQEFFSHFQHSMPDSIFIYEFPFQNDSAFNFQFGQQFPGNFDFHEFEDLQKQFEEQFKIHSFKSPDFKSPEQKEEWDKLMKKQQKEKEELMKKWDGTKL